MPSQNKYLQFKNLKNTIQHNWGGPTPFLPMEKCVFSHFSPWGKMGKKVYGEKGKSIHFSLFPYTFFPIFPHFSPWEKMGEHTFFHGQKWGWTPP